MCRRVPKPCAKCAGFGHVGIGVAEFPPLLLEVGSAAPMKKETTVEVRGRDSLKGMPRKITVKSQEIREAMQEPIAAIIEVVRRTLERAEPELSADLVENGICIAGGGALLPGIDQVISEATGLDVKVAEPDPLTCVAKGTSTLLDNIEEWKVTLDSDMDN